MLMSSYSGSFYLPQMGHREERRLFADSAIMVFGGEEVSVY